MAKTVAASQDIFLSALPVAIYGHGVGVLMTVCQIAVIFVGQQLSGCNKLQAYMEKLAWLKLMNNPMLIPRYLGGKSDEKKYRVGDGQQYDLALVPFGGSLRWTVKALQRGIVKTARVADSDPAVRAVWQEWMRGDRSEISDWIDRLVQAIVIKKVTPEQSFSALKDIIDSRGKGWVNPKYAAAKILLHQFVHGGNVRCNEKGLLNVSPRTDKGDWSEWLKGYSYELPWYSSRWAVEVYSDWQEVFQYALDTSLKTICFIDPPYAAPGPGQRTAGIGMSKAYANHGGNPNDPALLDMHKGAVSAAIEVGCNRIVATNYHGHWLQEIQYDDQGYPRLLSQEWVQYEEIVNFMDGLGFDFVDLGPLSLSAAANRKRDLKKAGQKKFRALRHEGFWQLGGNIQVYFEQPALELAA